MRFAAKQNEMLQALTMIGACFVCVSLVELNRQTVKKVTANRQKWKILTVNRQLNQTKLPSKVLNILHDQGLL